MKKAFDANVSRAKPRVRLGALMTATADEAAVSTAAVEALAQQIAHGAPADVFASANARQLDLAAKSGRIAPGSAQIFARNRLAVIYPRDNPAAIATLQDLARPGVKVVLAAASVPVGEYALEFLGKASQLPQFTAAYSETVLGNVVSYEESVRAVVGKVALGEADAGIVYTSDVTGPARDAVTQLEIPDALNVIATYPISALRDSAHPDRAAEFVALVLSPEGQKILAKYGFIPVHSD